MSTFHTHPSPYHQWTEAQKSPERLQIPRNKTNVPAQSRPFCKSNTHWRRGDRANSASHIHALLPLRPLAPCGVVSHKSRFPRDATGTLFMAVIADSPSRAKKTQTKCLWPIFKNNLKIILKSMRVWRCCCVRKWRRAWEMERKEEIMIIRMAAALCCLLVWLFWVRVYTAAARYKKQKKISKEYWNTKTKLVVFFLLPPSH